MNTPPEAVTDGPPQESPIPPIPETQTTPTLEPPPKPRREKPPPVKIINKYLTDKPKDYDREPPVPAIVLKAIQKLDIDKSEWNPERLRAMQDLARYLKVQTMGRLMMIRGLDCLAQAEKMMKVAADIAEGKDKGGLVPTISDRLAAVNMTSYVMKAYKDLSAQLLDFAKECQDKGPDTGPKMNLPPQVAVQINLDNRRGKAKTTTAISDGTIPIPTAPVTP